MHNQWFLIVLLSKSFSSHYLLVPPQTYLLASVQQPRAQILVLVVCFPHYQCLPTDHYCYYCYSKGLVVGLFSLRGEWACENFEFHCISGFLENNWGTYSLHGKTGNSVAKIKWFVLFRLSLRKELWAACAWFAAMQFYILFSLCSWLRHTL